MSPTIGVRGQGSLPAEEGYVLDGKSAEVLHRLDSDGSISILRIWEKSKTCRQEGTEHYTRYYDIVWLRILRNLVVDPIRGAKRNIVRKDVLAAIAIGRYRQRSEHMLK